MSKIELDKYYTSKELAKYCIDKTKEIIGIENIKEYIEPSAGNGVFLDYLDKPYLAYDIEPEDRQNIIIKQDYLDLNLDYKQGRCIIGNPPYGARSYLVQKFYKKSIQLGDYISFILPIGMLNNNNTLYEFDLIHSEDLGKQLYSDVNLRCCLNIYRRNPNGLNKKPNYKLKTIEVKEQRPSRNQFIPNDFKEDIRICFWGNIGKISEYNGQYSHEMAIKIHNDIYRNEIIELIKNARWNELYPQISTPCLYQWQVYKYIKEQIPDIE